jgi:hypothetical protein
MPIIIVGTIFIFILILGQKYPTIAFWIAFNLLFNPGGYVTHYIGTDLIGRINTTEIIAFFLLLLIMNNFSRSTGIKEDKTFQKLLSLLILFRIYYIAFYGYIVPVMHGYENFSYFLLKSRGVFTQFITLIGFYLFLKKDVKGYYSVVLYSGFICLSLYFVTIVSSLPLIPVNTIERYSGHSQIMRVSMAGYGLFHYTSNWVIIVLFLAGRIRNWKFPKAKLLYITGGMMIVTLLLTLTRRVYVELSFKIFLVAILVAGLYRISVINILKKIFIPFIIIIMIFLLIFPDSIDNTIKLYTDIYSLATQGVDTMGKSDYRLEGSGGLKDAKTFISDNLFFGSGYTGISFKEVREIMRNEDNPFISGMDASAEVWFWGSLFRYGIIGTLIWLPILILYIRQSKTVYKIIKLNPAYYISKFPIECVLFISSILFLIESFTSHIYEMGVRVGSGYLMNVIIIIVVKYRIKYDFEQQKKVKIV